MNEIAGTVLVCDYVGRRRQAPVSALGLHQHGITVHNVLTSPFPRELTAATYADQLWHRNGPFGTEVRAVLGYCAAAPIAQELAASLRDATGVPVPLVLFDGEPATAASIQAEYLLAADKLGELLSVDPARRTPPAIDPAGLRSRPREAIESMYRGLLEVGGHAPHDGSVDPETARAETEMFAAYYLDWLSHLIAAHNASWPAWGGSAVQIVSREHDCVTEWPGALSTETIRIAADRDTLLQQPEVAAAVLSILGKENSHAG
ncbi:hypothetical protein [Winogradskya humida]|uniref:Uncharacterized protein n=1 Tax=Winogradskya humida TaxID=113566 RepID=A0ABQ4A0W6_9ACTN|nr:hypothetical protein [Actinoplanes humidus]GIE24501.1 hypothetical protein Ahu01nite_076030 [Actinoplanes humidus]